MSVHKSEIIDIEVPEYPFQTLKKEFVGEQCVDTNHVFREIYAILRAEPNENGFRRIQDVFRGVYAQLLANKVPFQGFVCEFFEMEDKIFSRCNMEKRHISVSKMTNDDAIAALNAVRALQQQST